MAGNGERQSTFVAFSQAQTVDGVQHRVNMTGKVRFNPEAETVSGGGNFVHFDNAPPTPKPILATGLWEATDFISWDHDVGTYGHINASILELEITLFPDDGEPTEATLRLICNIGAVPLSTGEPEGFVDSGRALWIVQAVRSSGWPDAYQHGQRRLS